MKKLVISLALLAGFNLSAVKRGRGEESPSGPRKRSTAAAEAHANQMRNSGATAEQVIANLIRSFQFANKDQKMGLAYQIAQEYQYNRNNNEAMRWYIQAFHLGSELAAGQLKRIYRQQGDNDKGQLFALFEALLEGLPTDNQLYMQFKQAAEQAVGSQNKELLHQALNSLEKSLQSAPNDNEVYEDIFAMIRRMRKVLNN